MFDLADTLEILRQEKNMTVKELCTGIMAASTYYRFINKKAMINIDLYIQLLHRLKIELAMFLQTYTDYFDIFHHYELVRHALLKNEPEYCQMVQLVYQDNHLRSDEQLIYHLSLCVGDVLNGNAPSDQSLEIIYNQLRNGGKLTELEFYCMLVLIEFVSMDQIAILVELINQNILQFPDREPSEIAYYVYAKYLEQLILHQQLDLAHKVYQEIQKQPINPFDVGKKIYHLYINALCDMTLFGNHEEIKHLQLALRFLKQIQMDYQAKFFANVYAEIQMIYQLPPLTEEF